MKAAAAVARSDRRNTECSAIVAVARTLAALATLLRSPSQSVAREDRRLPGLEKTPPALELIAVGATASSCSSASDVAVRSGALKERRAGRRGGRRRRRSGDCDGTPDETGTSTSCGTSVGSKEVDPRGPGEGRGTGRGEPREQALLDGKAPGDAGEDLLADKLYTTPSGCATRVQCGQAPTLGVRGTDATTQTAHLTAEVGVSTCGSGGTCDAATMTVVDRREQAILTEGGQEGLTSEVRMALTREVMDRNCLADLRRKGLV